MTEKRGRRGAWPLGRKGFDGGAHRRGGGGEDGGGSDNPGGGGSAPVGRGGQEVEGARWGAARGLSNEEVMQG
jgi:hypothetical protein